MYCHQWLQASQPSFSCPSYGATIMEKHSDVSDSMAATSASIEPSGVTQVTSAPSTAAASGTLVVLQVACWDAADVDQDYQYCGGYYWD